MTQPTSPLISTTELRDRLAAGHDLVLADVSFDLTDVDAGERAWRAGHLPGSVYVHLDRDLCGAKTGPSGQFRGRHPLPERAAFAETLGRLGITPGTPVVAFDAQGGMYAARLWWMLRWIGHADAAVLDGGIGAWTSTGGALVAEPSRARAEAAPYPSRDPLVASIDADALQRRLGQVRLIDARAGERFRGEVEPLDKAAGHIPGALNRFFKDNLAADGRFKPVDDLKTAFTPLLGPAGAADVVHQCGSGVTACHNLLAMEHAGLPGSVLYPGSWSEWSADPARPIATG